MVEFTMLTPHEDGRREWMHGIDAATETHQPKDKRLVKEFGAVEMRNVYGV